MSVCEQYLQALINTVTRVSFDLVSLDTQHPMALVLMPQLKEEFCMRFGNQSYLGSPVVSIK